MRAAMFYEPGDVRMEDVPAPEAGTGEVLVRIGSALTGGTDVKTFKRYHPTLIEEVPSPFGHEFGGTIESVGDGVKDDSEPFVSGVRPLEDAVEAPEQHGRQERIKYEIRPPDGGSS